MTEIEEACWHILRLWEQYIQGKEERYEGHLYLEHKHTGAGEDAGEFLIAHGYAKNFGAGILLTDAGEALIEQEPS